MTNLPHLSASGRRLTLTMSSSTPLPPVGPCLDVWGHPILFCVCDITLYSPQPISELLVLKSFRYLKWCHIQCHVQCLKMPLKIKSNLPCNKRAYFWQWVRCHVGHHDDITRTGLHLPVVFSSDVSETGDDVQRKNTRQLMCAITLLIWAYPFNSPRSSHITIS